MLGLLLWTAAASALDGNDRLVIELGDGSTVAGWYYSVDEEELTVSGDNRFQSVPIDAITGVIRNDESLPLEELRLEIREILDANAAWREEPPPHPHPLVVGGLSMVWAGAGHAVLREWDDVKGYAILEGVVLGAAAYNIYSRSSLSVLVSLGALSALFRIYAASDSVRITQSRRARLGLK